MPFGSSSLVIAVVCVGGVSVLGLLALRKYLPKFGQLPGDLRHDGRRVKVFAPLTSMLMLSIILSVLLTLLSWLFG